MGMIFRLLDLGLMFGGIMLLVAIVGKLDQLLRLNSSRNKILEMLLTQREEKVLSSEAQPAAQIATVQAHEQIVEETQEAPELRFDEPNRLVKSPKPIMDDAQEITEENPTEQIESNNIPSRDEYIAPPQDASALQPKSKASAVRKGVKAFMMGALFLLVIAFLWIFLME